MRGKLIVIEGTDCSGKETQSRLLAEKLSELGIPAVRLSFPNYATPTGKIIGACYLGKEELVHEYLKRDIGWFEEGASHVDGMVSALYYAADRKYNISVIDEFLNKGVHVILDRYTFSNMAHQGGKINSQEERFQFFKRIELLEFELLGLPKPDLVVLLYVPLALSLELRRCRGEVQDQNERDRKHLRRAEQTYLELRALYHFKMLECAKGEKMRGVMDIHQELLEMVQDFLVTSDIQSYSLD